MHFPNMERAMLSDIPSGIVPIFRRPSASEPKQRDIGADQTRAPESAATAVAVPTPSAPPLADDQGEPATSAAIVPPSPAPTWKDLITAAEKRFSAPAPAPAPPRVKAEIASAPRCAPPLPVSAAERSAWRHACNWLELFRLCRRLRCRHAGRCRGDPVACLRAGVRHAPDNASQFVISMMKAQDVGLAFEEAFEDAADFHDAYFAWIAGLQAAQRTR